MYFVPYVISGNNQEKVEVQILPATQQDLAVTRKEHEWQTDWESKYLANASVEKFAMKLSTGELIALGAYQVLGNKAYVYIWYVESAPHSNPTIVQSKRREYYGIGEAMIAFGIKFSIDNGCRGVVVFDAKTDKVAEHYKRSFGAKQIASISSGGPKRFMLADEDAWKVFSKYLVVEEDV